MAKLRHVAIAVPDPEKAARFYVDTFGLKVVGKTESPLASGIYLSDGTVNLALLNYKTDGAAGEERGKDYAAGDIWGCVGLWFAGRWYVQSGNEYTDRVRQTLSDRYWENSSFLGDRG